MKKLQAILTECKIVDKVFGLREKQIRTAIAAAHNDIEKQETEAAIEYERQSKRLGDNNVFSYKDVLNKMIACKDTITRAQDTARVLRQIEVDLNSEVEVESKQ